MAVGIVSISTAALLIKLCADAPPAVIAASRLGVATLALALGGLIARRRPLVTIPPSRLGLVLLSGALLAAHFLAWVASLKHTSVLSSVVLVTVNPLFVGFASYLLFHEPIHRNLLAGLGLAAVGVGLISWADLGAGASAWYGNALALIGALMASGYMLAGRKLRREMDVYSYSVAVYGVAAVLLAALALAREQSLFGLSARTYLCLMLLGLVPQVLGHGALNWALRYVTATTVAVFILGEPLGACVFAYLALGERVTVLQAAGGALVLAGILIATREPRSRQSRL